MTDHDQELEDLVALVESPGWARFCNYVAAEWGSKAYRRKAARIIAELASTTQAAEAGNLLLQLETGAKTAEQIMGWAGWRIKALQGREEAKAR